MALQQISFPFGDEQPAKPKPAPAPPPPAAEVPEPAKPQDEPAMFAWEPFAPPKIEAPAADEALAAAEAPSTAQPAKPSPKSTRGRKSVKELSAAADLVDIPADDVLFKKQYYTIGEVAAMFHVNTSLIRFWETEFRDIRPKKNKKGDRYFTPADIKTLELIHFLLRQKMLTIEGAKEYLKANHEDGAAKLELIRSLEKVKTFLLELKARL
jgi:DNA-binding transcriptional MerR regulator